MFKKAFKFINRTFFSKEEAKPGSWATSGKQAATKGRSTHPAATSSPAANARSKSPEELCGIQSRMHKDEIKARLALLYRRYNRATSSLDPKLRAEAEIMLDAIVTVREKTFGPI